MAAKTSFLHVRTDQELDTLLESACIKLRSRGVSATKSSLARTILAEHFGQSLETSATEEALARLSSISAKVVRQAVADALARVPALVQQELLGE